MEFRDSLKFGFILLICILRWMSTEAKENVALKGVASQSSTLYYGDDGPFFWNASLAIDGDKSERLYINSQPTCSATEMENMPFWSLDLQEERAIERIVIFGRLQNEIDQLKGFRLYLKLGDLSTSKVLIFNDTSTDKQYIDNNALYEIPFGEARNGRYVEIELPRNNSHLVLCEVEVYEACPPFHFGNFCIENCGLCKNNKTCRSSDGVCFSGCLPGYQPAMCKDPCTPFTYGDKCQKICGHCGNNDSCNHITGACYSCANGYKFTSDMLCLQECDDGTYGYNCKKDCGHCLNDNVCNKTNGDCDNGCAPGFRGSRCKKECEDFHYGLHCLLECKNCRDGAVCNKTNGHCPSGCLPGYEGLQCNLDQNLIKRLSPASITTNMSEPLYVGMNSSLATDGIVSGDVERCTCCSISVAPNPWWTLDLGAKYPIDRAIIFGRPGVGMCRQFSGFRLYMSNISNIDLGPPIYSDGSGCNERTKDYEFHINLSNTLARYLKVDRKGTMILTICEVKIYEGDCIVERYGYECAEECHCADEQRCDRETGECQTAGCFPGWQGSACNRECEAGTFGMNCSGVCHCLEGDGRCNKENGVCESRLCAPGWQELNCSIACDPGKFGQNCSHPCRCLNGVLCDHVTGVCAEGLCEAGFQENNCSIECNAGTFGLSCSHECHCFPNITCDNVDGKCRNGVCAAGFQGDNCSLPCSEGFYGFNCSQTCGFCLNNQSCDSETGHCEKGCDIKFKGPTCKTLQEASEHKQREEDRPAGLSSFTFPGVLIAIATVLILAIIIALVVRKKRKLKPKECSQETTENAVLKLNENENITVGTETRLYQNDVIDDVEVNRESGDGYYSFFPRKTGLQIHELWDYINDHKSDDHFENEFNTLPKGLTKPCTVARLPENRIKNRYKDMYAYDQTRVVLSQKDDNGSDYINACYINGYEKVKKFIAVQGPTESIVDDFWKMIWQERVSVILMLTNLQEMGTVKCIQYWPDASKETFGGFTVSLERISDQTDYVVRELQLEKIPGNTRCIKQFHYKAWPDKNVPDTAWSLVQFWRAVIANDSEQDAPIVVHCSAGIGRTGTFIALDNLYHQAVTEGCIRPLQMVEALRKQRVNMVQTMDQYVFLHEALAEAFYFGTNCVFANNFAEYYAYMNENDDSTGKCRFLMQYELLVESLKSKRTRELDDLVVDDNDGIYSNADDDGNQRRNKGLIQTPKGGEVSETIKITAYDRPGSVVISQAIHSAALEQYLQFIDNATIITILIVTDGDDNIFKDFQPPEGVKIITYSGKMECPKPADMANFEQFVESVQKWQPFLSSSQPILIHSKSHLSQCVVISIILGEVQRLKLDGAVNILAAARQALLQLTDTIPSFEQYMFCHDVLLRLTSQQAVYANV